MRASPFMSAGKSRAEGRLGAAIVLLIGLWTGSLGAEPDSDAESSSASSAPALSPTVTTPPTASTLPSVPMQVPEPKPDHVIYFPGRGGVPRATTLIPELQNHLTDFLAENRQPIAAVVVADPRTGAILAMAQGRSPDQWGGKTHTALHPSFPAASVFKTVVTAAAFELADVDYNTDFGLLGGCSHVRESGDWLTDQAKGEQNRMNLRHAFGKSCNGFFAKIGVNQLGIGMISSFARKLGWSEGGVPTDFRLDRSPFFPPAPQNSSTHTVGRFAAGFGVVGLSAAHAAFLMMSIANEGLAMPLRLFRDSVPPPESKRVRLFSKETASKLSAVLDASVKGGTAAFAFRRGKYRKLQDIVGGKTGTLTGNAPRGITTWFAGMAPIDHPEVVVASVVVLDDHWRIKGPNLAAEGFWAYFEQASLVPVPVAAIPVAAPALPGSAATVATPLPLKTPATKSPGT